jgi:hypothetical protein
MSPPPLVGNRTIFCGLLKIKKRAFFVLFCFAVREGERVKWKPPR